MKIENKWTFLAYFICISVIGLFGNTIGIISTFRKKFKNMGPLLIFRCLFIVDSLAAAMSSEYFFFKLLNFDIKMISSFVCKSYYYNLFQLVSLGQMMHLYITLERFLCMKYPVESNLLKKRTIQQGFILISISFCLLFYLPIYFHHDIVTIQKEENQTKYNKTLCFFADDNSKLIIFFFGFINRIFLPIILTFLFSLLLISKIITARSRVYLLYLPREIKIFKRDIKLSIVIIISNNLSIILILPIILVVFFLRYSDVSYFYAYNIYYLLSFINFYVYLFAYLIFGEKKENNNRPSYLNNPERTKRSNELHSIEKNTTTNRSQARVETLELELVPISESEKELRLD